MFIVSQGILEASKHVTAELIATRQDQGEVPFSSRAPIVVTMDSNKIGDMVRVSRWVVKDGISALSNGGEYDYKYRWKEYHWIEQG